MPLFFTATGNSKKRVAPFILKVSAEQHTGHALVSGSMGAGTVFNWGANTSGQIGNNSVLSSNTPVSICGTAKTFCKISSGPIWTNAIDKNGRAWGWGYNQAGYLGDNTQTSRLTPVSVAGVVKTFCDISTGRSFSLALDKNGRAWSWGNEFYGELGDNIGSTTRLTPISVVGTVKTFCKIAAGDGFSAAIDKNGQVWMWGYGGLNTLGNNQSSSDYYTPISVCGTAKTFCQIAANTATCALDKNGRAWSWGWGFAGMLGNNSTTDNVTPKSVLGTVKTFCKISSGGASFIAIDKDGYAWTWGENVCGQLGDNTYVNKSTPVAVYGNKRFIEASMGQYNCYAIDTEYRAWSWGSDQWGGLGANLGGGSTGVCKSTPVRIYNL